MWRGVSYVHCKRCKGRPELRPILHGVHLGHKPALSGQCISLALFLSILGKAASLPHSSILLFWSPFEILPGFFPESPHLLEIICVWQYKHTPGVTKGLTKMPDFKKSVKGTGRLTREGARARRQKHSTAGIPTQVEPCRRAASLAPAGKNVQHVKTLHLSYHSINTRVTESHFQPLPLLLVLPGFL